MNVRGKTMIKIMSSIITEMDNAICKLWGRKWFADRQIYFVPQKMLKIVISPYISLTIFMSIRIVLTDFLYTKKNIRIFTILIHKAVIFDEMKTFSRDRIFKSFLKKTICMKATLFNVIHIMNKFYKRKASLEIV